MRHANQLIKLLLACMAIMLAMVLTPAGAFAVEDSEAYDPHEILVVYNGTASDDLPAGAPADSEELPFGVSDVERVGGYSDDDPFVEKLTVELPDGMDLDEACGVLSQQPGVAYAQKNYRYYVPQDSVSDGKSVLARVNDPKAAYQYHLDPWQYAPEVYGWCGANVRDAWDFAKCNKRVTIAVLDTGCLTTHQDLKANIDTAHMKDVYYSRAAGMMSDPDGHGTAVCSIAGAAVNNKTGVAGTSYNAKILPIKVFDDRGDDCESVDLCNAYSYLKSLMTSGKLNDLHVVNMSLGGHGFDSDYDPLLQQWIREFRTDYNVLTVCSGGNGGNGYRMDAMSYPSDFDACLSVTALDADGHNASWSEFNQYKDISAPGVDIYACSNRGVASYDWMTGTSAAAPLVSGCAALLWAAVPGLTADQAFDCLVSTAQPLDTSHEYYHSGSGSAGCIDATAAVVWALKSFGAGTARKPIAPVSATVSPTSFSYNGKPRVPLVDCYELYQRPSGGAYYNSLTEGVDFEVTYERNVQPGTGLAVIHGIGDYYGTTTCTFAITSNTGTTGADWTRLSGQNRYGTMQAIVSDGWGTDGRHTTNTVVVATGADFKDALAASGLAGLYGAPVIITAKGELTPEAFSLLSRIDPDRVYVAGGPAAIGDQVVRQIEGALTADVKRVWGTSSASTSAKIALAGRGMWGDTAIIATNKSFKDALSAAPISYALHYPILLASNGTSLNGDVLSALKSCGIKKVVIVGGPKAVTQNVVNLLQGAGIRAGNIKRVYGDVAVKTSRKIAEWGLSKGLSVDGMGVATSKNYPDALCGAAYVGANRSVLLLADDAALYNASFPKGYGSSFESGYVFGGESAVGMKTWNALVANSRW